MTKGNKTELLQVRVTPEQRAAVVKLAKRYDVPMCQIIRWAIAEYVEKAEKEANDEAR